MRWLLVLLFLLPRPAPAQDWSALSAPDTLAIMRHALAPGTGDPAEFTLGDCATQRNVDARGRAQAAAIGASLRAARVRFNAVLSSQWCRTTETAELLDLGPVTGAPALNSFFQDWDRRAPRTEAARALIAATPGRLMLVTHQVNISALTGTSTRSGEVLILRRAPGGTLDVIDRVLLAP